MNRTPIKITKYTTGLQCFIGAFSEKWIVVTFHVKLFLVFGIIVLLGDNTGCNSNSFSRFEELEKIEKVKQIKLYENKDYPIGRILDAAFGPDSILYILDIAAADIKLFNWDGKFIRTMSSRGKNVDQLQLPRALEVTKDYILVADIGTRTTKWFNKEGVLVREISVNRLRPIIGNVKLINENRILHAALWDGKTDFSTAIHLIDSTGKVLQRLGKYPEEYDDYMLAGNRQIDYNPKTKTYIITFLQSPAIFIGNLSNNKGKMFSFESERAKYISRHRPKGTLASLDLANKLTLEEAASDRVLFFADSIFVRSYFRCTEESLRKKSSVLDQHFLQAYSILGEFLGEISMPGRLHDKFGDFLLIEEIDEPDNHVFGLYLAFFKKTTVSQN